MADLPREEISGTTRGQRRRESGVVLIGRRFPYFNSG